MDEFSQEVYNLVSQIPRGKVATYGQIAAIMGYPFSARKVGKAMSFAPENLNLPCYRVINSRGEMLEGDAFGGHKAQSVLLKSEGVSFKSDGRVNLKMSRW